MNNVLTEQTPFDDLREEYEGKDEGERSNLVADIGEELNNLLKSSKALKAIPNQVFECGLYEDWINAHFANDCMDGPGNIHIDLDEDGTTVEVTVNAPLGDKIEGAFNSRLLGRKKGSVSGLDRVSAIKVGKKVSIGDRSGCFDDRNQMTKGSDFVSDEQLTAGLNRARAFQRS